MESRGAKQRFERLNKLLAQCNRDTAEIYSRFDEFKNFREKKHSKILENNINYLSSKFNGLKNIEDKNSKKRMLNFFLRQGEDIYTEELLKRKDGNYTLSHHLFIHNYLDEKGSFKDLETRITVLAHDFLEDIIKKSEKIKKYGIADQDKIKVRNLGLGFLEDYLKELHFNPKKIKMIKGEVQALSRVRKQHYFDYLDSMLAFSLIQSSYEVSSKEKVDEYIRNQLDSQKYLQEGIEGLISKHFKDNLPDNKTYKLLEIKIADRIHNTLTLPEKAFSYKSRLFEVAKSMYLVNLGKMMVQAGLQRLCVEYPDNFKEIKGISDSDKTTNKFCGPIRNHFNSFYHLARYLRDKKDTSNKEELSLPLTLLSRVSEEVIDLASVCINQGFKLKKVLGDKIEKSKKDIIDTEIRCTKDYDFLDEIYEQAAAIEQNNSDRSCLAKALDTLFSWYVPPKDETNYDTKKDVKPSEGYAIAKFLNGLIKNYVQDNSYYLEKLDQLEGRELWYDKQGKSLLKKELTKRR